jgi:hypothetical protein
MHQNKKCGFFCSFQKQVENTLLVKKRSEKHLAHIKTRNVEISVRFRKTSQKHIVGQKVILSALKSILHALKQEMFISLSISMQTCY